MAITSYNESSVSQTANAIDALNKTMKDSEEVCKKSKEINDETRQTINEAREVVDKINVISKECINAFEKEIDSITKAQTEMTNNAIKAQTEITKVAKSDLIKYKKDINETISTIHSTSQKILIIFVSAIAISFLIVIGFSFYPFIQNNKIKALESQLENLNAYVIYLWNNDVNRAKKDFNNFLKQSSQSGEND